MRVVHTSRRRIIRCCSSVAVAFAAGAEAHAQVVLDGTLGPGGAVPGPNFVVPAASGQLRGGNLFHSFSELSIAQGELLEFTGPSQVSNILARVTGPNASIIDGGIGTVIPGANLFVINPHGITFGPNAIVVVPGSFIATTADFVALADGTGRFDASTPASSVLTSAPPSAFGFLPAGGGASRIEVNGASLGVLGRNALTFAAGDVRIAGGFLLTQGGRANFVAAREGTLRLEAADVDAVLDATGVTTRGPVTFSDGALVAADGDDPSGNGAGGRVDVVAADATLQDLSRISSTTTGDVDGQGINFDVTGVLTLASGANLATASLGAGRSGDLVLSADEIRVISDGGLQTTTSVTTFSFGPGRSGDVRLSANSVLVSAMQPDTATVSTSAGGSPDTPTSGAGGNVVVVEAQTLRVNGNGASLRTSTLNDQAAPGGDISISADTIEVTGGAQVQGQPAGNGLGGMIDITARELLFIRDLVDFEHPVLGTIPFRSSVSTTTFATGTAKGIRVRGGRVLIENFGSIDTQTITADSAPIDIQVDTIELKSGARILADTSGTGTGGTITIGARTLDLDGTDSTISSSTSGASNGGKIGVTATERVRLTGGATVITASIDLDSSDSTPLGNGGALAVTAPDVEARDASFFSAGTVEGGNGGELLIVADRILFSGSLAGVSSPTVVTDLNRRSGTGGRVLLTATESITLERGARVSTTAGIREANSDAPPGTDTTALTGAAGEATLIAPLVVVTGRENPNDPQSPPSRVTSVTNLKTPGAGAGGNVLVTAGLLEVTDGGLLTAGTTGAGAGGNVVVVADDVLLDRGTLSATSTFPGDTALGLTPGVGGSVTIGATRSVNLRNNSAVTVSSAGTDAGRIGIFATDRIRLTNSSVVTSAAGTGGNIDLGFRDPDTGAIDPFVILFDESLINANAVRGNGGNIRIISQEYVTSADSIVTASSEQSDPGNVDVSAAYTEIAGGLVRLPGALSSEAARLQELCGMRAEGEASSFVVTGRGGAPLSPDGTLPSFDLPKR